MSYTPEEDDLPFERSSLASMGARRTWRLFGRNGASATESESEPEPEPARRGRSRSRDDGPLRPGMLESLALQAGASDSGEPEPRYPHDSSPLHPGMLESLALEAGAGDPLPAEPARRTRVDSGPMHPGMLESLALEAGAVDASVADADEGAPARSSPSRFSPDRSALVREQPPPSRPDEAGHQFSLPLALPPPRPVSPSSPLIEHSILNELAGVEERPTRTFPIERAILISLFAHVAIVLILAFMPERTHRDAGLLAGFLPKPDQDTPIPISFPDLPGPARPNPKRAPLSDADRRAGGGDPSKPKAETPYVPPRTGVAGLAPGPRGPRVPGSEVPARPGARSEAERRASAQPQTADRKESPTTERKPSEFPTLDSPLTSGPREQTKLAGLDQAIREAARGTVGGQGGSPEPNPGGGFVDSGPLSFDTKWYDWGPYAAEMIRRIKLHWDVPELARLGWKGSLTVRFFIMADGTVEDAKILRASGIPPFDFAAFQAILKSSKFRPLPPDLLAQVPGKDREGITVTFFYNMRMDEEEDGAPGPPRKSP